MKLPNFSDAIIEEVKLREYLLSRSHPVGRFKASYFESLGFEAGDWRELEQAFRRLIANEEAEGSDRTEFGQKYTVSGEINGPAGSGFLVTVWIVLNSESLPRFITAYPGG